MSSPSPTRLSALHDFPSELLDSLLLSVPPSDLQQTANSIMQVFPGIPISKTHLVRHLKVSRAEQLKPMWMRLRADKAEDGGKLVKAVKSFSMESWRGDADLMNNILRLLPAVEVLRLNMGTNFAPEHLQEVWEVHRPQLRRAEIRFRPYVDKASYYQFLKGSYFDSAIDSLIKHWPETPTFTHLSLVQDIPPRFSVPHIAKMLERKRQKKLGLIASNPGSTATSSMMNSDEEEEEEELPEDVLEDTTPVEPRGYTGHGPFPYLSDKLDYARPKTFAQPIVFFDIRCLARLAISDATKHITHLRLRVPTRDIARVLSEVPDGKTYRAGFPRLKYLDLSTTNLRIDGWLPSLIRRFPLLEHLILDRTNVFGFQGKDNGSELCADLGRVCVMMGMARSKDREREIQAWDLGERKQKAIRDLEMSRRAPPQVPRERGSDEEASTDEEGGEDRVAALPQVSTPEAPAVRRVLGQSRRGHRSHAMSSFSIRERPLRNRAETTADDPDLVIPPPDTLYLVLPPLPSLRSIGLGGEAVKLTPEQGRDWDQHFHQGWLDGLQKITEWAGRVGERSDRAKRAAEQWVEQDEAERSRNGRGKTNAGVRGGKKKAGASSASAGEAGKRTKPPLDVQLYRYPYRDEEPRMQDLDESDPRFGLVPITSEEDYKAPYLSFLTSVKAYIASLTPGPTQETAEQPPVILCMSADCEGPMRKGDAGERLDGRAAMGGQHKDGCGHMLGREVWGWQEV